MNLLARFVTRLLFQLLFPVAIASIALSFIATDRQTLQSSLVEADTYNTLVPAIIDEALREDTVTQGLSDENSFPLEDPEIRAVIERSIEPQVVQETTETLITAVYSWLDGSTDELEFEVDLTETRDELARNLVAYVATDVDAKPECVSVAQVDYSDVFNISCKPPGFSADLVREDVEAALFNSEEFEGWLITQDSFTDDDGKAVTEEFSDAPRAYQFMRSSVWLVGGAFAVVVVVFMAARLPLKNALHRLGRSLLASGMISTLSLGLLVILLPALIENSVFGESALAVLGIAIGQAFVLKVAVSGLIVSAVATAVGLVLFLVFRSYRPLENARA